MEVSHFSVMLDEVVENWLINKSGFFVDATFGKGGHSNKLLSHLNEQGQLLALDCDVRVEEYAQKVRDSRFEFVNLNFAYLLSYWKDQRLPFVDGILFDLGYSNMQLQDESSGLSYKNLSSLNMSFDPENTRNAEFILNRYSKQDLLFIFKNYGEMHNPKNIVDAICEYRKNKKIEDPEEFLSLIKKIIPVNKYRFNKDPIKLIFQALRIEVNDELNNLKNSLEYLDKILKSGGRALYLTFNSLEEKVIQEWIKDNCYQIRISDYGENIQNKFRFVGSLFPSRNEVYQNWSSRSARLWVIEKN